MTINPPNRVAMAQEHLSRYIESFKSRWQPQLGGDPYEKMNAEEAEYRRRCDRRDFEVELISLVQSAFTAAQAPFAMEFDMYRQNTFRHSLLNVAPPPVMPVDGPLGGPITMSVEGLGRYSDAEALAKRGITIRGGAL